MTEKTICSKRGVNTMTDKVYSRLASRHGFPRLRLPKRTAGNARVLLSSILNLCLVIALALIYPERPTELLKCRSSKLKEPRICFA